MVGTAAGLRRRSADPSAAADQARAPRRATGPDGMARFRATGPDRTARFRVSYGLDTLRGDLFGGVTSMVVALPVALGFGIASGMGAAAGLYGAIAVGFFASVFGGTRSQISGPTAPMTVAMAVVLTSHASSLAEALAVVVLAGLLQVLLGVSKIGRFVAYTPHVVVSGFMSGIGIIIILMQSLPLLGAPGATGNGIRVDLGLHG